MKLIINADDFGMSHEVNTAIRDSFRQGLISSTTLMANMEGFDPKSRLIASRFGNAQQFLEDEVPRH